MSTDCDIVDHKGGAGTTTHPAALGTHNELPAHTRVGAARRAVLSELTTDLSEESARDALR